VILDRILFASHLQDDEKLVYVVHSHWFAHYGQLFKTAFFGLAIPAIFYAMFPILPAAWIFGAWAVLGLIRFFRDVADWYFDAFLVTNTSVIDLDWKGLFDKASTRVAFDDLVSIGYEKTGFWSSFFNFGNLVVQTDSSVIIKLENAAAPTRAETEILTAKDKYSHERGLEDEKVLKSILSGMVKRHVRGEKEKGHGLADLI